MDKIKYVVRWTDQNGQNRRREYDDEPTARKARDWIQENGDEDADYAVILNNSPETPMFPTQPS